MTLDAEFRPVYEVLPELDVFADLPASRAALAAASGDGTSDDRVRVEDRSVTAAGVTVTVRIYTPLAPAEGPRPAVLWFHGGGFALGGPNAEDGTCRRLSAALGVTVVAPDYRLAPENPYPAGFDDCYAALVWVAAEAEGLGVDPARIALGGHSAGAALAAGVALAARDRSGPALAFLYLGYPVLDDRLETDSARTVTDPKLFNRKGAGDGWRLYLQDADPAAGYAVPGRATALHGLPPTYLLVNGIDPVRDEALAFASRLSTAGNLVELHLVPGVPHMFDVFAPTIRATRRAVDAWTGALAHGLGLE
ncbi:alpha/beta hydrolase [Streptomyces sp. NPDC093252]|uniref:alpha/beta hydrolase n=1 Tax=Streptomyces sp. NPDC093252 TaxID=3154980 RepID=UPI00342220C0